MLLSNGKVLLGKESRGGDWSPMGGRPEASDACPLSTAFREMEEETAGLFSTGALMQLPIVAVHTTHTPKRRPFQLFILRCDSTKSLSAFRSMRECADERMREKKELRWVSIGDMHRMRLRACFKKDVGAVQMLCSVV